MKKLLIIFVFAISIQNTLSQTAKTTVGGGLAYGDGINSIGLNITGQYFINEQIAIAPAFTYYFPSSVNSGYVGYDNYNHTWMEINIDGNYYPDLNLVDGKLRPYGLAGMDYAIVGYPYYSYTYNEIDNDYYYKYHDGKSGKIGLNVGAGASFDIDKNFTPFAQIKYTIMSNTYSQAQLLVGLRIEL